MINFKENYPKYLFLLILIGICIWGVFSSADDKYLSVKFGDVTAVNKVWLGFGFTASFALSMLILSSSQTKKVVVHHYEGSCQMTATGKMEVSGIVTSGTANVWVEKPDGTIEVINGEYPTTHF